MLGVKRVVKLKTGVMLSERIGYKEYKVMDNLALMRKVRRLLADGWQQGANALDKYGTPVSPISPEAVSFCMRGACIHVLEPSPRVVMADLHVENSMISFQIASAMGFDSGAELVQWNDEQGRTKTDVLRYIDVRIKALTKEEKEKQRAAKQEIHEGGNREADQA